MVVVVMVVVMVVVDLEEKGLKKENNVVQVGTHLLGGVAKWSMRSKR